jgi:hypothetical protein
MQAEPPVCLHACGFEFGGHFASGILTWDTEVFALGMNFSKARCMVRGPGCVGKYEVDSDCFYLQSIFAGRSLSCDCTHALS